MKIIADSSSNVYEIKDTEYSCVPLKVNVGNKEYVDTIDADVSAMTKELKTTSEKTSTSCPNVYDWQESFTGADEIFALTITSKLSGSYSSCLNAKNNFCETNPNTKIHIIDTLSTGPEMKLIIEKLQEFIGENLDFETIVKKIEDYRKNTHLFFCLESLINLARNGRVSPAVARIAGILGIRVVGKATDGTLEPLSKPRGEKKALIQLYESIKSYGYHGGKIRIDHCENEPFANSLKELILKDFPNADIKIATCGILCSYYAESGGILVGVES